MRSSSSTTSAKSEMAESNSSESSPNGLYLWANSVARPDSYLKKLDLRDKLLMAAGPTNIHDRVLSAMSIPIIALTDPQLNDLLREIQQGIRYVFQTINQYTFALTGSGTCAMETAVCNFMLPGQRLLSLVHGHWGERVAVMGERLGLDVIRQQTDSVGEVFELEQIEDALRTFRPKLLYVCHGDSSLGLVQPLDGIGPLCHKYDCLLMVDAVVSLCTVPLSMDFLEIDVLFCGAQKALSGPPGVSLISLSQRAVDMFEARSKVQPVCSFYMDIGLVAEAWGIAKPEVHRYHYTHAINLLYGLREAIAMVVEEGLEKIVQRHLETKIQLESMISQMGLDFLVDNPDYRLPGIIAVLIPEQIDGAQVIDYLYKQHDIVIGGSLLRPSDRIPKFWRLGFLGINADSTKIAKLCTALKEALQQQVK